MIVFFCWFLHRHDPFLSAILTPTYLVAIGLGYFSTSFGSTYVTR